MQMEKGDAGTIAISALKKQGSAFVAERLPHLCFSSRP